MKLLCTGDLHLGRRPGWLPDTADPRRHSVAAVWGAIVDHALEAPVDAVLLAGDVVDRDNRYFESYGPLERGLRRLVEAGIDVVAVAGNHDHETLPRLFRDLERDPTLAERLHLLGTGGQWERCVLTRDGEDALHIVGWSFPTEHVRTSPLTGQDASAALNAPGEDPPTVGLLHADLDQPGSPYAPLPSSDLEGRPEALWVLGHIHAGRLSEKTGRPPVLYAGSPQPLDPAETGEHSVCLVTVDSSRRLEVERLRLATLRYESVPVEVGGLTDEGTLISVILDTLRDYAESLVEDAGALKYLCCRPRLTGSTALHGRIEDRLGDLRDQLELPVGDFAVHVEKLELDTRPPIVLEELARSADVPGSLARVLLSLEQGDLPGEYVHLVRGTLDRLNRVHRASPYQPLRSRASSGTSGNPWEDGEGRTLEAPSEDLARGFLRRQGLLLLEALLAQKGDRG